MKRFSRFLLAFSVALAALWSCQNPTSGIIRTEVPERPAGQEDMLGFAAPALETVRIGFIGLGMRGPGAVERMSQIEGTDIVALCDVEPGNVEKCQNILKKHGRHEAVSYSGDEQVWKQLCERDDIDLVYIATNWQVHVEMAVYAMEHGKHVAIEFAAAM